MSASSTLPMRLPPRTRSMRSDVMLKRSEKKLSGRVRAISVIAVGLPGRREGQSYRAALSAPSFLDSSLLHLYSTCRVKTDPGGPKLASGVKGLNYLVDASDAVHEGRPRRKDIGSVDLVDLAGLHRRDLSPARPAPDLFGIDRLTAPRGENDLRIALDDGFRRDDAVGRRRPVAELGEDVASAGDLDGFGHPADSRDQRVHPLLEIDARAVGPRRRILPHLTEIVLHVADQLARPSLAAEGPADQQHRMQDVVERALIRAQDRHACADQVAHDVALEVGEGQDQIGLEGEDLLEPERGEAADPSLLQRRLGPAGRARDPDDAVPGAQQEGDLGGFRGETDDAPRKVCATRPVHPLAPSGR